MRITRIGPSFPLLTAATLGGGGGGVTPSVGSGLVPVSTGSNSWAWGSNVQTIQANGVNALGPTVNFADGSNTTVSVSSNTIRYHATGGGSFGSNSNQVSHANAPGASTDSSRADHVHMGVTSLAHSSNTFAGPVILTASGALGITSPTPGTYNLSATGGSGGSGAPTDAKYLVTEADATLSAERVVDLGAYSLLTRRAAANAEDDHFDASTLDAKWATYSANPTPNFTDLPGWLKTTAVGYIIQAVPAGDWTIETEAISPDYATAGFQSTELIMTNGTSAPSATDCRYTFGGANSLLRYRLNASKFVNDGFNATYVDYGAASDIPALIDYRFLRIRKVGTTYHFEWSSTGKTFHSFGSTAALGFTPTHFGLGALSVGSYFNYFLRY